MSGGFDDGDVDLEAAEYVLGTLDLAEREAFVRRMRDDDGAKRSVAAWEHRFAGLGGQVPELMPPGEVWSRIERALVAANTAKMHTFKVIDGGGQGGDGAVMRRSRNRWRTGALVTGAVAAALAVFIGDKSLRDGARDADPATYVAAVNRGGDKPAMIVTVDLKSGRVLVRPVAASAPAGHSLELWYIGTDKTPRSMGLVATQPAHLKLPAGASSDAGTFAVSVEPPGGSTTGGPTGPVVYAGQLVKE